MFRSTRWGCWLSETVFPSRQMGTCCERLWPPVAPQLQPCSDLSRVTILSVLCLGYWSRVLQKPVSDWAVCVWLCVWLRVCVSCREATTRVTRSSWIRWSMTSTSCPAGCSTRRPSPSSVPHTSCCSAWPAKQQNFTIAMGVLLNYVSHTHCNTSHPHMCYCSFFPPSIAERLNVVDMILKIQTFSIPGNGVVIHLPGLFEEAEKNLQKGKGNVSSISAWTLLNTYTHT